MRSSIVAKSDKYVFADVTRKTNSQSKWNVFSPSSQNINRKNTCSFQQADRRWKPRTYPSEIWRVTNACTAVRVDFYRNCTILYSCQKRTSKLIDMDIPCDVKRWWGVLFLRDSKPLPKRLRTCGALNRIIARTLVLLLSNENPTNRYSELGRDASTLRGHTIRLRIFTHLRDRWDRNV